MKKTIAFFLIMAIMPFSDANNITYKNITDVKGVSRPVSIHILDIDPSQVKFVLEHAYEGSLSREPVSKIADRKKALAAINAGFYRRGGEFNGNSLGILKINNVLYSDAQLSYGAFGWFSKNNRAQIDTVTIDWNLIIDNQQFIVDRLNQPCSSSKIVVYTPIFGITTKTKKGVCEYIVSEGKITKVTHNGNSKIPKNGYVLTFGKDLEAGAKAYEGASVSLDYTLRSTDKNNQWDQFDYIVSGAGVLVRHGKALREKDFDHELMQGKPTTHTADEIVADFLIKGEREWFIKGFHPRTAIGITKEDHWILVVVDGRNKEISEGMSLEELAQFMKKQGCVQALNLGGGGCTTMWYNGNIINCTSGSSLNNETLERPVSDALLVLPKESGI